MPQWSHQHPASSVFWSPPSVAYRLFSPHFQPYGCQVAAASLHPTSTSQGKRRGLSKKPKGQVSKIYPLLRSCYEKIPSVSSVYTHWPELCHVVSLSCKMKVYGSEMASQPAAPVTSHKTISLVATESLHLEINHCFTIKHQEWGKGEGREKRG